MNDPRCDMGRGDSRCQAQAAGSWLRNNGKGRAVALCEDHRLYLEDQRSGFTEPWIAWNPSSVTEAIHDRLRRMAAGYFG